MLSTLITKALIFKPKKLGDKFESKYDFWVDFDAITAFNVVKNAENKRKQNALRTKSVYFEINPDILREQAYRKLYTIQSSHSNYIDWLCVVCGLFSAFSIFEYTPQVWNGTNLETVRALMISVLVLLISIALYFYKKKTDEEDVEDFLNITDGLYFQQYGESRYK